MNLTNFRIKTETRDDAYNTNHEVKQYNEASIIFMVQGYCFVSPSC